MTLEIGPHSTTSMVFFFCCLTWFAKVISRYDYFTKQKIKLCQKSHLKGAASQPVDLCVGSHDFQSDKEGIILSMYQSEVCPLNLIGESLFSHLHVLKHIETYTYGIVHVSERVAETVWNLSSPIFRYLILVISFPLF